MSNNIIDFRTKRYKEAYENTMRDCVILYSGKHKPVSESLMGFGWECSDTWNEILSDLSYKLEALNITYYYKYRVRIEATQVKEKFGTLRFYYNVHTDVPRFISFFPDLLEKLCQKISRFNFHYKNVVDIPQHIDNQVEEMTKDEYERRINTKYKPQNVDYDSVNGRYYRVSHMTVYAVSHQEPTRLRFMFWLMKILRKFRYYIDFSSSWPVSNEQHVISRYMSDKAEEYIRAAENKTECICSKCGAETGYDDNHPSCVTTGYISILCRKCADETGYNYTIGNKVYNKGKFVKEYTEDDYKK